MRVEDRLIYEIIVKFGGKILRSDAYASTYGQVHHVKSTVAEHTIDVAILAVEHALRMWKSKFAWSTKEELMSLLSGKEALQKVKPDFEALLSIALCHDLGIIGRYAKYANNYICCNQHPKDSVTITRQILPGVSDKVLEGVGRHMFPLTPIPPTSVEGWIVIWADKRAPFYEMLRVPIRPRVHLWIRQFVEDIRGASVPKPGTIPGSVPDGMGSVNPQPAERQ